MTVRKEQSMTWAVDCVSCGSDVVLGDVRPVLTTVGRDILVLPT